MWLIDNVELGPTASISIIFYTHHIPTRAANHVHKFFACFGTTLESSSKVENLVSLIEIVCIPSNTS